MLARHNTPCYDPIGGSTTQTPVRPSRKYYCVSARCIIGSRKMREHRQFNHLSSLQFAAAVQKALLDDQVADFHFGNIAAANRMSDEIGGDFYYFRQLNDDQVALAIGDVVGHGTSAALVVSLIIGVLQADQQNYSRPKHVINNVNEMLLRLSKLANESIICSMFYGVVDLPSGILFHVNAGHPHPIICNRQTGDIRQLDPTTMLLGAQAGVRPESCHQFITGDRLVLFTDGIIEAKNSLGHPLGQPGLRKYIGELIDQSPDNLVNLLLKQVQEFSYQGPQEDDQSIVVIDFDHVSTEP